MQIVCITGIHNTMESKRESLFNIKEPFEITVEDFAERWPHVSNIWAIKQGEPLSGDPWKVFNCHLLKRIKSSTRKEGVAVEKHHKTSVRDSEQCLAEIKITYL